MTKIRWGASAVVFALLGQTSQPKSNSLPTLSRMILDNPYYTIVTKPKTAYRLIGQQFYGKLPDTVQYYQFACSEAERGEIASCTHYINQMKKDYQQDCIQHGQQPNKKDFAAYWIKGRQSCFLKLKRLYPVLVFEFNNPGKEFYKLGSMTVRNYIKVSKLGGGNPYLNNESLGKEILVIDPQGGDSTYFFNQAQVLENQRVFDLALTCLTTDYRSDDQPDRLMLDITFNFEDKAGHVYPVKTKPFFIDL